MCNPCCPNVTTESFLFYFLLLIKAAVVQSILHTDKVKNIYFPLLMSPCWLWHVHWLCAFSSTRQTGLKSPSLNPRRVFEVNRFTLCCSILLCRLWQRHRKNFHLNIHHFILLSVAQFSCTVSPALNLTRLFLFLIKGSN